MNREKIYELRGMATFLLSSLVQENRFNFTDEGRKEAATEALLFARALQVQLDIFEEREKSYRE